MAESALRHPGAAVDAHRAQFLSVLPARLETLRQGLFGLKARPNSATNRRALERRLGALSEAAELLGLDSVSQPLSAARDLLRSEPPNLAKLEQLISELSGSAELDGTATESSAARESMAVPREKTAVRESTAALEGTAVRESTATRESPTGIEVSPPASRLAAQLATTPTEPGPESAASFLLLGPAEVNDELRISLEPRGLDVIAVSRLEDAVEMAQTDEPHLAVVDTRFPAFEQAITRLSRECSVIGFGDVALQRRAEKAGARAFAGSKVELVRLLERPTLAAAGLGTNSAFPLNAMVDELTEELRRALEQEASDDGALLSPEVRDAARAVTWSAITKLRQVISDASNGNVCYDNQGPEGALLFPPSRRGGERPRGGGAELQGRTVLVADDDPAVLWFIGSALRAAGATVLEASDGMQAWEIALREEPELVVSDVMMPQLDGFSLCRNLKRDVALSDVPVVLLSWKEDLLQRVRELGAGADGYLSKDSEADVLTERCAEALRPRAQLEQRLAAGGVVHGRLDGVTPRFVLNVVVAGGSSAVVEFCDAGFAYEAHCVQGRLIAVQRRATDGSVQLGPAVLAGLLGMRAGRFIVRQGEPIAPNVNGNLQDILAPHVTRIRRALHLVQSGKLYSVERLQLEECVLGPYLASAPPVARKLINKLREGTTPALLQRSVTAGFLETVLLDLAMRGALTCAFDASGSDLLLEGGARPPLPVDGDLCTPAPATTLRATPASEMPGREVAAQPSITPEAAVREVAIQQGVAPEAAVREVVAQPSVTQTVSARETATQEVPAGERGAPHSVARSAPVSARSENVVLFADSLRSVRQRPEDPEASLGTNLDAAMDGEALPEVPQPATSTARPHKENDAQAPTKAKAQATSELSALGERLRSLSRDGTEAIDLGQAVLAGLSLTPRVANDRVVTRSNTETRRSNLPRERATTNTARDDVRAKRPETSRDDVRAKHPETSRDDVRATGSLPSRETLVQTLTALARGWDAAKQGAGTLVHGAKEWLPRAAKTDATTPLAPEASAADARETSVSDAAPAPLNKAAVSAENKVSTAQVSAEKCEAAPQSAAPSSNTDDGATDPEWLPPVASKSDTDFAIPLTRTLPQTRWLRRAAAPAAVISLAGVAAFSVLQTLRTTLPQGTDAPVVAAQDQTAEGSGASEERSAAETLLAEAQRDPNTPREEEPSGPMEELVSQELPLPQGVTLEASKGLLEVNTGDKHKIYVSNVFVGRGPARRIPLAPGQHEVRTRLGAEERSYNVQVGAGKRTRLEPVKRTAGR